MFTNYTIKEEYIKLNCVLRICTCFFYMFPLIFYLLFFLVVVVYTMYTILDWGRISLNILNEKTDMIPGCFFQTLTLTLLRLTFLILFFECW